MKTSDQLSAIWNQLEVLLNNSNLSEEQRDEVFVMQGNVELMRDELHNEGK